LKLAILEKMKMSDSDDENGIRELSRIWRNTFRGKFPNNSHHAGAEDLSDEAILATLIGYAMRNCNEKYFAKELLRYFGNFREILDGDFQTIKTIMKGHGNVAIFFKLLQQVARIYHTYRTFNGNNLGVSGCIAALYSKFSQFWCTRLRSEKVEVLEIAYLSSSLELLPGGIDRIGEGDLMWVPFIPQYIVKHILECQCRAVFLCHNHPIGNHLPSEEDERLTRGLQQSLNSISVELIDHFIVGLDRVYAIKAQREIFSFSDDQDTGKIVTL
jgi:DNA repair protein RadC